MGFLRPLMEQQPGLPSWMASQGGAGLSPPQMPPQPGSANALQDAFSGNPGFQSQLHSMMGMQGPGAMGQVSYAPPPGGPMPPISATPGGGGRSIGGMPIRSGGGITPGLSASGALNDDLLRRLIGSTPTTI